ncbi:MAG: hypothetical protein AAFN41_07930 [Planctomycetota bacterium]
MALFQRQTAGTLSHLALGFRCRRTHLTAQALDESASLFGGLPGPLRTFGSQLSPKVGDISADRLGLGDIATWRRFSPAGRRLFSPDLVLHSWLTHGPQECWGVGTDSPENFSGLRCDLDTLHARGPMPEQLGHLTPNGLKPHTGISTEPFAVSIST